MNLASSLIFENFLPNYIQLENGLLNTIYYLLLNIIHLLLLLLTQTVPH